MYIQHSRIHFTNKFNMLVIGNVIKHLKRKLSIIKSVNTASTLGLLWLIQFSVGTTILLQYYHNIIVQRKRRMLMGPEYHWVSH
jgi:hypothetical protein